MKKNRYRIKKIISINNSKGFSLIELLVVVAIIATLAGIGVPSYNQYQKRARRAECIAYLATCYKAQGLYYAEREIYTRLFADINTNNSNFPPLAKTHYYDYGLKANDNTFIAATQSLDYPNFIDSNGQSRADFYNVSYIESASIPAPALNAFNCACRGNIDGDATADHITIDQNNIETIISDDLD